MPRRKGTERSEAQIIADKHNGNCFCLEGIRVNLERIALDCIDVLSPEQLDIIEGGIKVTQSVLRLLIEKQYEYEKDTSGKSTPQIKLVDTKQN